MAVESSPHQLITARRVIGTSVFDAAGQRIGQVEDLSIHKVSGRVMFAILSFGGVLGMGERYHPLPWSILEYDPERAGYVVSLEKAPIESAPSLNRDELEEFGAGESWTKRLYEYYEPYGPFPYV